MGAEQVGFKVAIKIPATALAILLVLLAQTAPLAASDDATAFLSALEGRWHGRAELTPIGPRPYDITFTRTPAQQVAGSAHPGDATHYWTFYADADQLHLRFLTTFAGNRDPVFLDAREWGNDGVLFRAGAAPILSVRVNPLADRLLIDVFHWDKPHVAIRLKRQSR